MTLSQLEYIIALDRYKSYVRAAEKCSVTQPALTIQVKKLEEELGVVLFNRARKPVEATEAGRVLIDQALAIVMESRKLADMAEGISTTMKGALTLGIIPTVAPYLISVFIDSFNQKYPEVNLIVREGITADVVRALKLGEIEAGIIATPIKSKGLTVDPLFYERFYLYVSDLHPLFSEEFVDTRELSMDDLWLLNEGNCFRNQIDNICGRKREHKFGDNFAYESTSIESLRRIVEHRKGITFLPELATLSVPAEKEEWIKEVKGDSPVREISLITVAPYIKQRLVNRLKEEILSNIPTHMQKKPEKAVIHTGLDI